MSYRYRRYRLPNKMYKSKNMIYAKLKKSTTKDLR